MINTLLGFLFIFIGYLFGQVGCSQISFILLFGMPFTKKLSTLRLLNSNNIVKRYIMTIVVYSGITILVSILVFIYTGISLKIGYSVGFIISSLRGISRCGWTEHNMIAYVVAYEEHLRYPPIRATVELLNSYGTNIKIPEKFK